MKNIHVAFLVATAAIASQASAQTVSGAYLLENIDGAMFLQLTSISERSFGGTLMFIRISQHGKMERRSIPLDGISDRDSITITLKEPLSIVTGDSFSGSFNRSSISLIIGNDVYRLARTDLQGFQAAMRKIEGRSEVVLEQTRVEAKNVEVANLNKQLHAYAAQVLDPAVDSRNKALFTPMYDAIARARQAVSHQQRYPRGSDDAYKIAVGVDQTLTKWDWPSASWIEAIKKGRAKRSELETKIALNPCMSVSNGLSNCASAQEAVDAYWRAQGVAKKRADVDEPKIESARQEMKLLSQQANAYAR